jgi:hypothetical protein
MPNKPKPIAFTVTNERSSNYFDVLVELNPGWRVIVTRDGLSYALQRRVPSPKSALGYEHRRSPRPPSGRIPKGVMLPDCDWFGVRYCSTSAELRRAIGDAGNIDPAAAAVLAALPAWPGAKRQRADDILDQLAVGMTTPAKPRKRKGPLLAAGCGNAHKNSGKARAEPASAPSCQPAPTPPSIENNEQAPAGLEARYIPGAGLPETIRGMRERLGA